MKEHYDRLKCSSKSNLQDIKSSYKKLVKIHHPDLGGDVEVFKLLSSSYEFLLKNHKDSNEFWWVPASKVKASNSVSDILQEKPYNDCKVIRIFIDATKIKLNYRVNFKDRFSSDTILLIYYIGINGLVQKIKIKAGTALPYTFIVESTGSKVTIIG